MTDSSAVGDAVMVLSVIDSSEVGDAVMVLSFSFLFVTNNQHSSTS